MVRNLTLERELPYKQPTHSVETLSRRDMRQMSSYTDNGTQGRRLAIALLLSIAGHLLFLSLPGVEVPNPRPQEQTIRVGLRKILPHPATSRRNTPAQNAHRPPQPRTKVAATQPSAKENDRKSPTEKSAAETNGPVEKRTADTTPDPVVTRQPSESFRTAGQQIPQLPAITRSTTSPHGEKQPSTAPVKISESRVPSPAPPPETVSTTASQPQAAVIAPTYLDNPRPRYPPLARQRGWQGDVLVRVSVDPSGRVVKTRLERSSGHRVLDRSALKQIRRWRFRPASRGETKIAGEVTVPVHFRLRSS
ncbi:hypothetical protein C2E25_12440 [Geothermobacter hydrogeniphilus]|uniref:TonB C-terminal domain-containing protein n=2 Tax=Geothermobacter hydrogeniphilus TaxID=1969733 RepID=A0A2K2H820_9BACT|nr:hypothetical protein C2E25_12440 [Geothermobacter hydrogeniphilus]